MQVIGLGFMGFVLHLGFKAFCPKGCGLGFVLGFWWCSFSFALSLRGGVMFWVLRDVLRVELRICGIGLDHGWWHLSLVLMKYGICLALGLS